MMAASKRHTDGPETTPKTIHGRKPNMILNISFIITPGLHLFCSESGPLSQKLHDSTAFPQKLSFPGNLAFPLSLLQNHNYCRLL